MAGALTVALAIALVTAAAAACRATRRRQLRDSLPRIAAEHAKDGLAVQRMDGTILWVNPAYCRLMGRHEEEVLGRNPLSFALPARDTPPPEEIARFRHDPDGDGALRLSRNVRKSGEEFWNEIAISVRDTREGERLAILVCRDATATIEKAESQERIGRELRHLAAHDPLSNLANRAELMRRLGTLDLAAEAPPGLIHIDLDHFKEVNDRFGHAAGDAVVAEVGARLRGLLRGEDLAARLGGDEFVVLAPAIGSLDALGALAGRLHAALSRPVDWNGRRLPLAASLGAALAGPGPAGAGTVDALLMHSDAALYEAKRAGRDTIRLYDAALAARQARQGARRAALRSAVEEGTLAFRFRPTMDLATGHIRGLEALACWPGGDEDLIGPADHCGLARDLGLMAQIDLAAMEAALAVPSRLAAAGLAPLNIGFHASAELLLGDGFVPRLRAALARHAVPRGLVSVGIRDSVFFGEDGRHDDAVAAIRALGDEGVAVLLDGFSMGRAGLGHLADLPVDGLRLDRRLVAGLDTDPARASIVAALGGLARDLGLRLIADGVDTPAIAERLVGAGDVVAQGALVGPALRGEDLVDWLSARAAPDGPRAAAGR